MRGLVIRKEPLRKILDGLKTWEMRGSAVRIRGTIALIESKSGTIVGLAELVDCLGPLSRAKMLAHGNEHRVDPVKLKRGPLYPLTYAWVLTNVREFKLPLAYRHRSGAVIWVNLEDSAKAIARRTLL